MAVAVGFLTALIGCIQAPVLAQQTQVQLETTQQVISPDSQTQTVVAPERIVAVDAKLSVDGQAARISFRMSRLVKASSFLMLAPDRAVIDLPEVNFQLPVSTGRKGEGVVVGYRYGLFAPGRSRIVIDLAEPARVSALISREVTPGVFAFEIELQRTDRASFIANVAAGNSKTGNSSADSKLAASGNGLSLPGGLVAGLTKDAIKDKRPLVVIDPGHGGIDPGAVTANVAEKTIVLAFGQKLRDMLGDRYRVMMTRDDDRFISLADRVKLARQNGADLFISIHADSLSQAQDVRGATIYTASERATDLESARLAARENQADALAGVETPIDDREDVADILMDLAKRETRAFSSAIATRLVSEMGGTVKLHRIPQRSAGFRVLSAPDVPSVLIELGYVTSAKDIELLTSETWRVAAAGSVQKAIDRFFDLKSGKKSEQMPSRENKPLSRDEKPIGDVNSAPVP